MVHFQQIFLSEIFFQFVIFHPQTVYLHLQVHILVPEFLNFPFQPFVFFLQFSQPFGQHCDLLLHSLIQNHLLRFYKLSSLLQIPGPFHRLIHFLIIIKKGSGKTGPFHQFRNRYQLLIFQHSVDFPKGPAYLFSAGSPV